MKELKSLWKRQSKFNSKFYTGDAESYTKDSVLYLIDEATELLRSINYKKHYIRKKDVDPAKIREELVDVFKYWLNICLVWKITPEQFIKDFHSKSDVVELKYLQELMIKHLSQDDKICAIDIDGVLCDYPKCWIDFVNKELHSNFTNHWEMKKALKIEEYNALKHKYRSSGVKANLPVIRGARQFLLNLSRQGYKIIILSSRPVKTYSRIYSDTMSWLQKKQLIYDALYFGEEKCMKIVKLFPNISFMVEDNLSFANEISNRGYKVYLLNNDYNQGVTGENVVRVDKLGDIRTN